MMIVWSQICKQSVANVLHLSGKYGGVKVQGTLQSDYLATAYKARWTVASYQNKAASCKIILTAA